MSMTDKVDHVEVVWSQLDSHPLFPKFAAILEHSMWGRSEAVVHAPPEDCLCWYLDFCNPKYMNERKLSYGVTAHYPHYYVKRESIDNFVFYTSRKLPLKLATRESLTRFVWVKMSPTLIIVAWRPVDEEDEKEGIPKTFKKAAAAVRATVSGYLKLERLPHRQTKFTYALHSDPGGFIPNRISNLLLRNQLSVPFDAFVVFERSSDVDKAVLNDFSNRILAESEALPLTPEEERVIETVEKGFNIDLMAVDSNEGWRTLVIEDVNDMRKLWKETKEGQLFGKASCRVHASPEHVVSWIVNCKSVLRALVFSVVLRCVSNFAPPPPFCPLVPSPRPRPLSQIRAINA